MNYNLLIKMGNMCGGAKELEGQTTSGQTTPERIPQIMSNDMYDKKEAEEAWRSILLPHEILVKSVH